MRKDYLKMKGNKKQQRVYRGTSGKDWKLILEKKKNKKQKI